MQRCQNAERAEQSGAEIGDRDADAHRALPGQAGDRHQSAHALRDLVVAGPVAIGAVLAEAGDAGEDNALVEFAQGVVIDAKPVLHVRAVVFDHHVGLRDHALEGGKALRRLEVEGHAALVAMQVLEVRPVTRAALRFAFLQARRRLDLDDVGTPIGELADAGRPGTHAREVEDGEAGKGLRCPGNRHFDSSR